MGPVGNKKMTQTRLSFTGTPLRMTQGNNVHTQQGDLDNSMTCKEGRTHRLALYRQVVIKNETGTSFDEKWTDRLALDRPKI